jgi:hypothetical protein
LININVNTSGVATNLEKINNNTSDVSINLGKIDNNISDINSNLEKINLNTSGVAENLGKININTSGVATNLSAIGVNLGNINLNTSGVTTNLNNIATNTSGVAANLVNVDANTSGVAANLVKIDTNTSGVATNLSNIATNTSGVAANLVKIDTNTSGVAANLVKIDTNTSDVSSNLVKIDVNTAGRLVNQNNIQSNLVKIDTNLVNIQTNISGVASNVGNILSLEAKMSHLTGWREYVTDLQTTTVIKYSNNAKTLMENTTVVAPALGKYRLSLNYQYSLTTGNCVCSADLSALWSNIYFLVDYVSHALAYGSETLTPGRYKVIGAASHSGILTLDAQNDPDAEFIFVATTTYTVITGATTVLINGAKACNVFILFEGALSVAIGCSLKGTYINKLGTLTAGANLTLEGRILSLSGVISLGTFNASVPLGTSRFDMGPFLPDTLLFSGLGAVSTTIGGYTNTQPQYVWRIMAEAGLISNFGPLYDGSVPTLISGAVGMYQGDSLISLSENNINQDTISNFKHANISCTVEISTEEEKTITVKSALTTLFGGIVFGKRSIFLQPLL